MGLFSQRKGIRPLQKNLQRESIDDDLRNRLWSATQLTVWSQWSEPGLYQTPTQEARLVDQVVQALWLDHFKQPSDTIPHFAKDRPKCAYEIIRTHFFDAEWWQVYDFIEFLLKTLQGTTWSERLTRVLNKYLEEENAAYRLVNDEVVEIVDKHEIEAVESAIDKGTKAVQVHLSHGLTLLSDRKKPDYRNSIKESISAVESACQAMTGDPKATLGHCLKIIKDKAPVHPALEQAFNKLYGYTSDGGGIRHALTDDSVPPSFADAKFMLVACSSFCHFLWTKAAENGIKLPK